MSVVGRSIAPSGRVPRSLVMGPLLLLGGIAWTVTRPPTITGTAPPATTIPTTTDADLVQCSDDELVMIFLDDSGSVIGLDESDVRGESVDRFVDQLWPERCSDDDVVAVVSFAGSQSVTGPAPADRLGPLMRADEDGTDIASAAQRGIDIARSYPDHRPVAVMISDYAEGSPTPLDDTLARLDANFELITVSIGDFSGTTFELTDSSMLAASLIDAVNGSRETS